MNRDAWLKELYEANYNRLYKLASHRLQLYVGHTSDVLDVLQDVFLEAVRKEIYNHPSPEGWLFRTTENVCRNYRKAHQRRVNKQIKCDRTAAANRTRASLQMVEAIEDETAVSDIMLTLRQTLTEEEYELVNQCCIQNRPIREVAGLLNMSETALRVRIFRLRKNLKNIFREV